MTIIPSQYQELESICDSISKCAARCIVFSSPHTGAGNTSLAFSVARRLGEQNERVLLIDVNSHNPMKPSKINEIPSDLAKWSFADISVQLNNQPAHGFYFLSISALQDIERVREKDVFTMAIAMLKQEFDYILFDTSPLLKKNYANFPRQLLLSAADLVLVSVSLNKTTQEQLDKSLHELNKANCSHIEFVANYFNMPCLGSMLLELVNKKMSRFPSIKNQVTQWITGSTWLFQGE